MEKSREGMGQLSELGNKGNCLVGQEKMGQENPSSGLFPDKLALLSLSQPPPFLCDGVVQNLRYFTAGNSQERKGTFLS